MYWNEVLLLFSITPLHSDAFHLSNLGRSLKFPSRQKSGGGGGGLAMATIPEHPFPLPHHCGIFDLPSTPSMVLVGWMIQNFLPQTTASTAVWHYTEGSQPATAHRLGHSSNTWDTAISTTKRKQKRLFMNTHECKGPPSTVMEFLNLMPSWGKCININGECVEKQCTSAKELHVPL